MKHHTLRRAVAAVALLLVCWAQPAGAQPGQEPGVFVPDPPGAGRPARHRPAMRPAQVPFALLDSTKIEAGRDAYVASDHPDTNYGSEGSLYVGQRPGYGTTRSLLWFETLELERDQAVTHAELRMHLRGAEPVGDPERDVLVRRVKESWDEHDVTWNDLPAVRDRRVDGKNVGTAPGWFEWDISELVQRWRWPDRPWDDWHVDNHGLMLQGYEAENSFREFDSSESSREPEIKITHTTDTRPPVATLKPLAPYQNKPDPARPWAAIFRLEWVAEDPAPATGIDYFRVEVQRNAEPWFVSAEHVDNASSGLFSGANGKRFGFRVQAVDMAGNVEPVTPAEVQTLVDLSPPVSEVRELPEYVRGPFTLSWSGHDEPSGAPDVYASGVLFYFVNVKIDDGPWGLLWREITDTSRRFRPKQGHTYAFQVRAVDRARNYEGMGEAEARTHVDGLPPSVVFDGPTSIDQPTFTVEWEGVDPGGSGVTSFDIQYRRDREPWQDWAIETTQTRQAFTGEFSHVYSFRGRARDRAGNQGQYPVAPQLNVGVIDRSILGPPLFVPLVGQHR